MTRWLPKKKQEERNRLIVELSRKGLTPTQIAPQVRMSTSNVWKILKEAEKKELA